jgi:GNAT superfamily N-acetyltransferase
MSEPRLTVVPPDHPDALALVAELQAEYVVRYGEPDETPVDPAEFAAPDGLFLVAYQDSGPVGCGGWRARGHGRVEIKRMFVRADARGRGLSRVILAALERTARDAGHKMVILETATRQPEAIGLYRTSGYAVGEPFGHYAGEPESRYFIKSLEVPNADLRTG